MNLFNIMQTMKNTNSKLYIYMLKRFNNITIKQANIFSIGVIFIFSTIFVSLLVEDMYHDYEIALEQSVVDKDSVTSAQGLIDSNKKKLKTLLIKTALVTVTLAFIIFGIFLGLNNIFNRILQRDTQTFLDFFENAAHNDQVINPHSIFFKDFKVMVGYANEMVTKINEQKNSLKELNLGLEDRVKNKTIKLELINKNLEKEKEFSQKLLTSQKEFLRHTVHETNTPLSVILTSIDLYNMKNPKDRHLSKIEAAAKNIFNIYDDLSYLVKKDQVTYPKIAIELNEYLRSRIDFFAEVAALSKLKMIFSPFKVESYIYFNETKLQRIVDNTITNAIKYTLPNEEISIKIQAVNIEVDFLVSSKSKEIKDKDKVFDSFYREEKSREGFGIGLGLVKNICDEESVGILLDSSDARTTFRYRFKMMGE